MIIIGICGRSGSGKGYVCKLFSALGALHVDTDVIYHDLLLAKDNKPTALAGELAYAFGNILMDNGEVDRKTLGKIVFSDDRKRKELNTITHRAILAQTKKRIENSEQPFVLIDAPLLFESGFDKFCDVTVCVTADEDVCIDRIIKRDGIERDDAKKRLCAQISSSDLIDKCDYVIYNNPNDDVKSQVELIIECITYDGKD